MLQESGIDTLLELDQQILDQGNGYWIKIEARRVTPTKEIPHGKRILGYDNAHAVKLPKKFKFAGQRLAYDRKHRNICDQGVPYEFQNAYQLLMDFFAEVDKVLEEIRKL